MSSTATNNPWDLSRAPGGSSGGASAALAAGLTGLELGSDIGSSIRNPAHYCGVFGHKPSYGIVPWQGHAIPGDLTPTDINVCGPLARSAEDLAIALDVLTTDPDKSGWRLDLPASEKRALGEFRVAVMLTSPVCAQDDALTDQLKHAIDGLVRAGVKVDDTARPDIDLERSHHVYLTLLRAATGARLPEDDFLELRERAATRAEEDHSFRAYMARGAALPHRDWVKLNTEREGMRLAWADFFKEVDLLLCPTAASAAFPHDQDGERVDRTIQINGEQVPTMDQLFWAGLGGVVYLPATVAPAGLTRSGLPCGLQVVGPYLHDRTCIEFARLMEQELGGFTPPPGYE